MAGLPSALVCLLYAGEPSLTNAIQSIEKQRDIQVHFILVGNHPKQLAHERLFKTLNAYSDEYDLTLFLGADMELVPNRLLAALAGIYLQFPSIDHAFLGVEDWFSGEQILGVHSWRRGVQHATKPNRIFTDVVAHSSRQKFKLAHPRTPLILHGQEPSELQAIRYGAQRAMKAAALNKSSRWDRLGTFTRFVAKEPSSTRLLALAAIDLALEDAGAGLRFIAGDHSLSVSDLDVLHQRAESADLIESLVAKLDSPSFRSSVSREGSDSPTELGQSLLQRLSQFTSFSATNAAGPSRQSVEEALYGLLAPVSDNGHIPYEP